LVNEREISSVYKNGELLCQFPPGVRLVTDRQGGLRFLIGMTVRRIAGSVVYQGRSIPFAVSGNERLEYSGEGFRSVANPGVIPPNYGEMDAISL
jgi:hypothetical protein